jgi:hypothetical protein
MTDAAVARVWGSQLTSVVVYARGAVCRRLARGTAPADGRVRVSGLPRTLEPGSLRAHVVDAAGVRVTEARVVVEAEPAAPEPPEALMGELKRLEAEERAVRTRRERTQRRVEETAALRPVPPPRKRDDPHRQTPVEAWLDLAEFVDARLAALHTDLTELDERIRVLEHEIDVLRDRVERESDEAASGPVTLTASAELVLTGVAAVVPGAGATDAETGRGSGPDGLAVELEYRVPGAVWVPSYRLDGSGGRLVLRASVAQRTGEDWTGVRLGLSTADLLRPTGVPELRSIRIGRSQPVPAPSGWREAPTGLTELFAGYDGAGPRPSASWPGGAAGGAVAGGPVPAGDAWPGGNDWAGGGAEGVALAGAAAEPRAAGAVARSARPRAGGRPRAVAAAAPPAPVAPGGPPAPAGAPPQGSGGPVPAAPGGAVRPPPPPPVPGPPQPTDAELDYAGLVLAGPDAAGGGRGVLAPGAPSDPVAAEYRRRAESPAALPLPGFAVRPRDSAGSFDHRYDAQGPADIPSDGTWHTVTVTDLPVRLRTEYLCVPSVEETVYATLVVSNATGQALLAGPVDVTVDGDPLPTTALPTLAPGGTGRVGLGPAEAIRVARRTELRESTAGLRNTTTVLDHRVHVELSNGLPRPVTVEVRERVPVTSESDIRIEERPGWTTPADGDGPDLHAPGTRLWRVEVPAGDTAALDGGYEIRIPAAKALTGGNRRS